MVAAHRVAVAACLAAAVAAFAVATGVAATSHNTIPGSVSEWPSSVTQAQPFLLSLLSHPVACRWLTRLWPSAAAVAAAAPPPSVSFAAGIGGGGHAGGTAEPIGSFRYRPPPFDVEATSLSLDERTNLARRAAVRAATSRVWRAYTATAAGWDEVRPISGGGVNNLGGMVATAVDSLSTLMLMGLEEDVAAARAIVDRSLSMDTVGEVSVFETTIRILGGLLSAYHLSGDGLYRDRAVALGTALAPAFDTLSGLPWPRCDLNETSADGSRGSCRVHPTSGDSALLAEVGSMQLEMRALAHAAPSPLTTRLRAASEAAVGVVRQMAAAGGYMGLVPSHMALADGRFTTNLMTLGAPADSYFEYLIKAWVQGGRSEPAYLAMWHDVMRGVLRGGVAHTSLRGDTILRSVLTATAGGGLHGPNGDRDVTFIARMDHFSCYFPGAIVAALDTAPTPADRDEWLDLARRLTASCHAMYARSPSGLAGEHVRLAGLDESWRMAGGYHLRPEALEAFFHMYRATGDPMYREWTWEVFQAMEHHCKTPSGALAALKVARASRPVQDDIMHSFLLAETLKYAYLVFEEPDVLPTRAWVFNTEAHPLLVTPPLGEGGGLLRPIEEEEVARADGHGDGGAAHDVGEL